MVCVLSIMSALNFLNKNFMNISLNGNSDKGVMNGGVLKGESKKTVRFVHGSYIMLKKGYYKGYKGYVVEHYPETVDVKVEYFDYVFMKSYGKLKMGSMIMTQFGNSMVVNVVEKLYIIKGDEELRLPLKYIMRLVYIKNSLAMIKDEDKNGYKLCVLELKNKDLDNMLLELSKIVKDNCLFDLLNKSSNKFDIGLGELNMENEYCIVISGSENVSDKNYIGSFGKFGGVIDEQYMIKYDRIVRLDKKMVEINNKKVIIKKGQYKNKIGDVICIHKSSLNIYIDALNKNFTRHTIFDKIGFKEKNIEVDDVFYYDVMLNDGSYVEVKKITDDLIYGYSKNRMITFKRDDIKVYLSGFKIIERDEEVIGDQCVEEEQFLNLEQENVDENDDDDVNEITEYESGNLELENEGGILENDISNEKYDEMDHIDMKQSYKDVERCGFISRIFSKNEKDILSNIDRIVKILNYSEDIVNKYVLLEKVKESIKIMKDDLEKIKINRWKTSDIKYVTSCLVIYDIIKSCEGHIDFDFFTKQVEMLYKVGYLTKTDISGTTFLRTEDEKDILHTCFGLIIISRDESEILKRLYKQTKYLEIIIKIMENCGIILQEWFGKINITTNKSKIEILSVSDEPKKQDYPKYFLTTNDILSGNIPDTSRKIIWGPRSNYLVNVWKRELTKKMEMCNDDEKKIVYKYVIDNFNNAIFMRNRIPDDPLEKKKYKELMRTFVNFVEQLREYTNLKVFERSQELNEMNIKKEKVNKRRREINEVNNLNVDLDNLELNGNFDQKVKVTKRFKISRR